MYIYVCVCETKEVDSARVEVAVQKRVAVVAGDVNTAQENKTGGSKRRELPPSLSLLLPPSLLPSLAPSLLRSLSHG